MNRLKNTSTCVKVSLHDLSSLVLLLDGVLYNIHRDNSFVPHRYENLSWYQTVYRLYDAACAAQDEARAKGEYYGVKIEEATLEEQ